MFLLIFALVYYSPVSQTASDLVASGSLHCGVSGLCRPLIIPPSVQSGIRLASHCLLVHGCFGGQVFADFDSFI